MYIQFLRSNIEMWKRLCNGYPGDIIYMRRALRAISQLLANFSTAEEAGEESSQRSYHQSELRRDSGEARQKLCQEVNQYGLWQEMFKASLTLANAAQVPQQTPSALCILTLALQQA